MPEYNLIAARDGDLITSQACCPDYETAETWALHELVRSFGLEEFGFESFEEASAETDGVELTELPVHPVTIAAERMLFASVQLFSELDTQQFAGSPAFGEYALAAVELTRALRGERTH